MSKAVTAILKEVEDAATGAVASYHVIEYYAIDLRSNMSTVTVNGYVSAKAMQDGRQPLSSHTANLQGIPGKDTDAVQWLYQQLTANETAQFEGPFRLAAANPFVGAEVASDNTAGTLEGA